MKKLELVCCDGIYGKRWAVKKVCKGFFYNNSLYLFINGEGLPAGYTEDIGSAWWGTKTNAEIFMKLEQ